MQEHYKNKRTVRLSFCLSVRQHFWCDAITQTVLNILVSYFEYMLGIMRGRHILFFSPFASVIEKLWAFYYFFMWRLSTLSIMRGSNLYCFSPIAPVIQRLWALYWFCAVCGTVRHLLHHCCLWIAIATFLQQMGYLQGPLWLCQYFHLACFIFDLFPSPPAH